MSPGKRTGYASLPLHGGKAPAWLFSRMVLLSREILAHIVAGVRRARGAAPDVRSVLVSSIWLRAGLRLAFQRRDDHRVRRRQGIAARGGTRMGPLRGRRKRRRLEEKPCADYRRLRPARPRPRRRSCTPAARRRRSTTPPSRTAISSTTTYFCSPRPVTGRSSSRG